MQDEVEALDDEDDNSGEERGTFKRASADVLAGRKIVKIRRYHIQVDYFLRHGMSLNSMYLHTCTNRSGAATAQPNAAPSVHVPVPETSMISTGDNSSERAKKVKKLNESFLKWAAKQIETHPLSIWKEGVKVWI